MRDSNLLLPMRLRPTNQAKLHKRCARAGIVQLRNLPVLIRRAAPQVQSAAMSTKLRNRRVAEDKLGSFLEQALVSEDLIHQVMDAPVSGVLKYLRERGAYE